MAGLGLATSILFSACTAQKNVNAFVTTADQSMVFKPLSIPLDNGSSADANTIVLNPAVKFQEMDGFGAAITGSTCYNLLKMKANSYAGPKHDAPGMAPMTAGPGSCRKAW